MKNPCRNQINEGKKSYEGNLQILADALLCEGTESIANHVKTAEKLSIKIFIDLKKRTFSNIAFIVRSKIKKNHLQSI